MIERIADPGLVQQPPEHFCPVQILPVAPPQTNRVPSAQRPLHRGVPARDVLFDLLADDRLVGVEPAPGGTGERQEPGSDYGDHRYRHRRQGELVDGDGDGERSDGGRGEDHPAQTSPEDATTRHRRRRIRLGLFL